MMHKYYFIFWLLLFVYETVQIIQLALNNITKKMSNMQEVAIIVIIYNENSIANNYKINIKNVKIFTKNINKCLMRRYRLTVKHF